MFWTIYRFGRCTVSTQRLVWAWDYRQIKAFCHVYTTVYDAWGGHVIAVVNACPQTRHLQGGGGRVLFIQREDKSYTSGGIQAKNNLGLPGITLNEGGDCTVYFHTLKLTLRVFFTPIPPVVCLSLFVYVYVFLQCVFYRCRWEGHRITQ